MSRPRAVTVIAIDLMRCWAAGLVVLYHFGAALPLAPSWQGRAVLGTVRLPAATAAWTWCGWVGVEIFFVISGLVIAASARGARPGAFLRRRAWRLLPAAWLCASVTAMALKLARPELTVMPAWLTAALMLPSGRGVDPSYWTLSIEAAFYALVAATLVGGGEARRLERMAMALGCASIAFWAAAPLWPDQLASDFGFQMTLLPHGCFFALGALLRRGPPLLRFALLGACGAEIAHHAADIAGTLRIEASPVAPIALFLSAVAIVAAAGRLQPALARTIGERASARAGAVTYPLYLLHQVAGAALAAALIRAGVAPVLAVTLAIAAAVATACAVAWRAEPALRALSRSRGPAEDIPPSASLPIG